ncbi:MAG: lysylphosphatidylglycerol synthase transmembrane domain-containing protein [Planctomycetota bacterium]
MSRRNRWFLHFAILALLLLAAWMFVDFAALGTALRRAPLPTVAVLVVAYCLDRLAMALKWQPLLRAVGIHIPLREVVLIYFEASFVGRALPTALGGDALRIYRVSKISGQTAAVVSAAAVEKIAGIIAAALIASFGAIWLARDLAEAELHPLLIAVPGCAALTVVLFGVSLSTKIGATLVGWLPGAAVRRAATKFLEAYQAYRKKRGVIVSGIVYSLLEQALQVAILFFAARAVGITAPTGVLVAVLAVSEFLRKIAIVLEGWGLATIVTVGVLALAGIDENEAFALAILATLIAWLAVLPGGLLLLRARRSENED